MNKQTDMCIKPYRILDLSEDGCMICGRILADLGADVIKIEPPGGSKSRIGPFYGELPDPEKSLYWFAYNGNKRSITLDINTDQGQSLFKKLIKNTQVVIESFQPGYLNNLGLSYADLKKINPKIIVTSITPFGQNGPKAGYRASDLTVLASSSFLYICGEPNRSPTWISFSQASLFGGGDAATGTMMALYYLESTGKGQQVDVSIQESCLSPTFNALAMWDVSKVNVRRLAGKTYISSTGVSQNIYFLCKDGYVMILVQGGGEPHASSTRRLVEWMDQEGMAPDWLKRIDWVKDYDASSLSQDLAEKVEAEVARFTLTKTKSELYEEGGIKRRILLAPVSNMADICHDEQLKSRDFWQSIEHPELGKAVNYCGPFLKMTETPIQYRMRPPQIGEHNADVYIKEMGMSEEQMNQLKQLSII